MRSFTKFSAAWLLMLALVGAAAGCTQTNNILGGGAVTVKQVAQTIQRECRNTEPNGDCIVFSRVSTDEKNRWKGDLQEAQDYLVLANATNITAQERGTNLEKATVILEAIERILLSRGIE